MVAKVRHECERCGQEAVLERAGRYRDEDYVELFRAHMELEQAMRGVQAIRQRTEHELARAREEIESLRALIPQPEPEGCPF